MTVEDALKDVKNLVYKKIVEIIVLMINYPK